MAQAIADRGKKEKGARMTQDIIEMAKQAGWKDLRDFDSEMNEEIFMGRFADLEYFAKLATAKAFQDGYEKGIAAFNEAVELEREACAKVVLDNNHMFATFSAAKSLAEGIRARTGNKND
jgi:hypothetical protein